MHKKPVRLALLGLTSTFAIIIGLSSVALARDGMPGENVAVQAEQHSSAKLEGARLKACKNHERVINARMQRIAARGARHMEVFDKIAARVESFADTKGKKPANFDALLADVNAKKATAQATLDKIKSDSVSFKCDGSDPKGVAEGFKADLKAEIAALKEYKTAVKNLIVGVKSANAATGDSEGGTE